MLGFVKLNPTYCLYASSCGIGITCDVTVEGKHIRRKISKQELEIFQQRYISAVTVAEHLQTSPKKVVQLLSEGKILPITGSSIDGGRQYLFHKADVEVFVQHFE